VALGMALSDTGTDGLVLGSTPVAEQGKVQGFMVGGRSIGTIVAASAVGLLAAHVSWLAVFWVLAALTLLPLPLIFGIKEGEKPAEKRFEWSAFSAFKKWPVIAVGLAGLVIFMVIVGANQLINPYLEKQLGISLSQAGFITSLWGIGVVVGSIVGGLLMSKVQVKKATLAILAMVSGALLLLAFLVLKEYGLAFAIGLIVLYGVAYGAAQTVTFAFCMRVVDQRIAASMFAILMAMTNVGQGIGLGIGGALSDAVTFRWTFVIFAALNLLVLPLLPSMFKHKEEQTVVPEA